MAWNTTQSSGLLKADMFYWELIGGWESSRFCWCRHKCVCAKSANRCCCVIHIRAVYYMSLSPESEERHAFQCSSGDFDLWSLEEQPSAKCGRSCLKQKNLESS